MYGGVLVSTAIPPASAAGVPRAAVRAGSGSGRDDCRFDGRCAARCDGIAINEMTGNRFEAVTDERGMYRMPARVGAYQMTAELQGFTSVTRTGLQLLVGQTAVVNMQMAPSTVQETVTVTAETPLAQRLDVELGRQHRSPPYRNCLHRAATGCRWRCSRRAVGLTSPARDHAPRRQKHR